MRPTTGSTGTRAWRRPAAVLAALVAVGVSGCSLLPDLTAAGPSTQQLADGSAFLVSEPANAFAQAIVSGRLALIGGECIGLDSPGGQDTSALAFPHGTHPSADGSAIVLPDGLQVRLGDTITGGGGYTTLSQYPDAFASWPQAPAGCAQATYLAGIYDVTLDQGGQG